MRDIDANPYSADERRVADFIVKMSKENVGGGDDPIGFLMTSYAWLIEERKALIDRPAPAPSEDQK